MLSTTRISTHLKRIGVVSSVLALSACTEADIPGSGNLMGSSTPEVAAPAPVAVQATAPAATPQPFKPRVKRKNPLEATDDDSSSSGGSTGGGGGGGGGGTSWNG